MNVKPEVKKYETIAKARRDELYSINNASQKAILKNFKARLSELLAENLPSMKECTPYQLSALASINKGYFPPIDHLAVQAAALDCSIGYLLGQHQIKDIKLDAHIINPRIQECYEQYKAFNDNKSLLANEIIRPQWISQVNKGETPLQVTPYLRIANALGWDIDYVLGLRETRSWLHYCIKEKMSSLLPDNLILYVDGEYGRITPDKKAYIFTNGKTVPAEDVADVPFDIVRKPYLV